MHGESIGKRKCLPGYKFHKVFTDKLLINLLVNNYFRRHQIILVKVFIFFRPYINIIIIINIFYCINIQMFLIFTHVLFFTVLPGLSSLFLTHTYVIYIDCFNLYIGYIISICK